MPLIPIALATGWSALIVFAIGIPLNPMSATLGALVIAISTEFSVLLSERFRQEREAGHDLPAALARTYRSTGTAVLASGITAIAGFGVLVLLEHHDAARFRLRDADRPVGVARRGAAGAAGGARALGARRVEGARGRPVPAPSGAAAAASPARPSGVSERPPDAPEEPKPYRLDPDRAAADGGTPERAAAETPERAAAGAPEPAAAAHAASAQRPGR